MLARIRAFFAERQLIEVETPLLCSATVTDPHLESWRVEGVGFLQTSPEYAMKRLLAAGSGSIYQISKAFRKDEAGKRHNREFTLLEWYRTGFDHWQLMEDVADLLEKLLGQKQVMHLSYRQAFENSVGFNPHQVSLDRLRDCARQCCRVDFDSDDRDLWLNLLLSHRIEPELGRSAPTFLYDYPASQAALAQINIDEHGEAVAERFELYIDGMEIANGYRELTDPEEQLARFDADLLYRQQQGLTPVPIDRHLLAALKSGLPDCAGVALGIDRLLMKQLGVERIDEVLSFSQERV